MSDCTTPLAETVATFVLLELQVTTRSVTTVPFASFTTGASVVDWPATSVVVAGSVTLPTGTGVTVTAVLPFHPSLDAVMNTGPPGATPVTTPAPDTLATSGLLLIQVTTRPVSTLPFASFSTAVAVAVC